MKKSKDKYKVSVIVPTYNRSRLLSFTLDSLLAQTADKCTFEVIVADDGSSDDTKEMLIGYKDKLNLKYLYQYDIGYRPSSARNMGIKASQSEICLLIDSGVVLHEACIDKHVSFHELNEKAAAIGYVYGFEEDYGHGSKLEKIILPTQVGRTIEELRYNDVFFDVRNQHYIKYNNKIETLPAPWYYFWTCHVSALRNDLLAVNMFDVGYDGRWGVEDNDLGFRLHRSGVKICLLKEAESIHCPHPKSKKDLHLEGFENSLYFNSKFQTLETQVFHDHFLDKEFFDINEAVIQLLERSLQSSALTVGASSGKEDHAGPDKKQTAAFKAISTEG